METGRREVRHADIFGQDHPGRPPIANFLQLLDGGEVVAADDETGGVVAAQSLARALVDHRGDSAALPMARYQLLMTDVPLGEAAADRAAAGAW